MTRHTHEHYMNLRYATRLDATRKLLQDLEDDQIVRERQGAGHPLAGGDDNRASRGMKTPTTGSLLLVSLTSAV